MIPLETVFEAKVQDSAARAVLESALRAILAGDDDPGSLMLEDPWTRSALIYRPTADGFNVYSVGKDGVDDEGKRIRDRLTDRWDIFFEYPKPIVPIVPLTTNSASN